MLRPEKINNIYTHTATAKDNDVYNKKIAKLIQSSEDNQKMLEIFEKLVLIGNFLMQQ